MEQHALAILKDAGSLKWLLTNHTQESGDQGGRLKAIIAPLLYHLIVKSQELGGTGLGQFWHQLGYCPGILKTNIEILQLTEFDSHCGDKDNLHLDPSLTQGSSFTSMTSTIKEIVRSGYDSLSFLYRKDNEFPATYKKWLIRITDLVKPPSPILDLGCGCGVPISKELANQGFKVVGVDISAIQIDRAKSLIPQGHFIQGDLTSPEIAKELSDTKFSAIIALYVIIHIPLEEQPIVIKRIAEWLDEGGYCLLVAGVIPLAEERGGWLGSDESVRMAWAQAGVEDYRRWIADAGFHVIMDEYEVDFKGDEGHQFFLLKK